MAFQTLIDSGSLHRLAADPRVAVLDCRFDLMDPDAGRRAYAAGHIPGAHYVQLDRDLSARVTSASGRHPLPSPGVFAARMGRLGIGDDTQVVAYDEANGSFASRLWWMLRWMGHTAVAVLDGGLKAWVEGGGALESGPPEPAPALFSPRIAPGAWLSTGELIAALRDPRTLLVDARAPERFAGSVEPIDPVAGHMPGAVNHPFGANLRADGRFLAPEELAARWRSRLGGKQPGHVIAMCGSGVTACHNLLALEVAGLPGAKLYAGSWSEWIRDGERPVARG